MRNKDGKRALDRTVPLCQETMKGALCLFDHLDDVAGPLLHLSRTACVFKVNQFGNFSVNGLNEEKNDGNDPIPTALKCVNSIQQVSFHGKIMKRCQRLRPLSTSRIRSTISPLKKSARTHQSYSDSSLTIADLLSSRRRKKRVSPY